MNCEAKFCFKCNKRTLQKYIGKKTAVSGNKILRIIVAILSLGMTETIFAEKYYQCEDCGHINIG